MKVPKKRIFLGLTKIDEKNLAEIKSKNGRWFQISKLEPLPAVEIPLHFLLLQVSKIIVFTAPDAEPGEQETPKGRVCKKSFLKKVGGGNNLH